MTANPDVLIIGGGLAGLSGAIHLSKKGLDVTIIEKAAYPKHKVCGEYISNEILPYLEWLGVDIWQQEPAKINRLEFSNHSGEIIRSTLPLGGFGISRYTIDNILYKKALANGCKVMTDTVTDIAFKDDVFTVTTQEGSYQSKIVIGAYGKRSNIDQVMARDFVQKKSPWLAVKAHYKGEYEDDVVGLHNFNGGYCGVSKVEGGKINICYLADYHTFKKYKNIEEFQRDVLGANKHLKKIFAGSRMLFDKPVTISQVSFEKKKPVEGHVLMTGDTAGLIHPLCGNGMAMAIHSTKIAAELVLEYYSGTLSGRQELENKYEREWNKQFNRRMIMGRMLGKLFRKPYLTRQLLRLVAQFPGLLTYIIKQTHGKPIAVKD